MIAIQKINKSWTEKREDLMKTVRHHLLVNILPVALLLSIMAAGMAGVNLLLH